MRKSIRIDLKCKKGIKQITKIPDVIKNYGQTFGMLELNSQML